MPTFKLYDGSKIYIPSSSIVAISEASASGRWRGIYSHLTTIDGKSYELMNDIKEIETIMENS
jgi:hypothetical protein